jgi:hypothetical protein
VTEDADMAQLFCPTAIAIHNYGNMVWDFSLINLI